MKIYFILINMILVLNLFNCNSNNNGETKAKKILRDIKARTERDLKKLGIKKVLLYKKGVWYATTGATRYIFKKKGILIVNDHGDRTIRNWKIDNNKFYIKFKFLSNRFYRILLKPTANFSYSIGPPEDKLKFLKSEKYALIMRSLKKIKNSSGKKFYLLNEIITISK